MLLSAYALTLKISLLEKPYSGSTECLMHTSLRLQNAPKEAGPVMVTLASNVRYEEEGEKKKKIYEEPFRTLITKRIAFSLPIVKRISFMKQT